MKDRMPAEAFPPGEFVREELKARGWSQTDLAQIIGRPHRVVNEIVAGKRAVTPETAKELGEAFGTSPQLWMNLETSWRLWKDRARNETIARKARLYSLAPIGEMVRRGWLEDSSNVAVLEQRVLQFFELHSLDQEPALLRHVARKSADYETVTTPLQAWIYRARQLAQKAPVSGSFGPEPLEEALIALRALRQSTEGVREVPRVLARAGIRFVVVAHLNRTKVDGATLWLEDGPVVAVSMRYDRLDWFWFTLMHEFAHVKKEHGRDTPIIDSELVGVTREPEGKAAGKPQEEVAADAFAADFCVPDAEMTSFIQRVRPLYSKTQIRGFAARLAVHPALVVGQLQRRNEIQYAHSRETLDKVRHLVAATALTDGWGNIPPVGQ